jgi:cysteine sulfinate desulfinase/cysteine desulfurase-like protein
VLETCRWFEKFGYRVTLLPVDADGLIDPQDLKETLTDQTILVSIMMANNETGTIQPIAKLATIAHEQGAIFHTDATQAVGKIPVDVEQLGIDMLSLSAHKLYGPKGVGAFYMRKEIEVDPLIHGGKQEYGLRSGTENLANIVGLGAAAESAHKHLPDIDRIKSLRDQLETGIRRLLREARTIASDAPRLPNTLCMVLPEMRGESMTLALDQKGVSISPGSACRSGSPKPSHALLATGLSEEDAHCAVRFSLGRHNTEADIERTLEILGRILKDDTASVRFVPCR